MKRFGVFLFSFIFLLLAGTILAPSFIDWNAYKSQLTELVKDKTGFICEVKGDLGFSILPMPRFYVNQVSLGKSQNDSPIASFERLDVHLLLKPLLSGHIKISSVNIVKPTIALEKTKNGDLNIITPQIESFLGNNKSKDRQDEQRKSALQAQSMPFDISLDKVQIKEGRFSYHDKETQRESSIQNINLDVSAQSLIGPFSVQGSLFYEGHAVNVNALTKRYDAEEKLFSARVDTLIQPGDISLTYNGIFSFDEKNGFSVQGQSALSIKDLAQTLTAYKIKTDEIGLKSGAFEAKGLLSADAQGLSYKDVTLAMNEQSLHADMTANFEPFSCNIGVSAPNIFALEPLINQGTTLKNTQIDIMLSDQTNISLTAALDAIEWENKSAKNITLGAKLVQDKVILESLSIKDFGGATLNASGEIKDRHKQEGITAYLEGKSLNIKDFVKWLGGDVKTWPDKVKKTEVKAKFTGSGETLEVTANLSAMDAKVMVGGKIDTPFKKPMLRGITMQLKHKNMNDVLRIFGDVDLKDKSFHKPLDIYAEISQEGETYAFKDIKGDLSGTSVEGTAKLNLSIERPNLSANLKFGKITAQSVLNDTDRIYSKAEKAKKKEGGKKESQESQETQKWSKKAFDTALFHLIDLDLNLSAQAIKYGNWPLIDPQMTLKLKNGALSITDLKANVFNGTVRSSISAQVENETRAPIHFESKSAFKNVNLEDLSKALIGESLADISGNGSLDLTLKSSGVSPAALIYDLGGEGKLSGAEIILKGVDVTNFVTALSDETKPGESLLNIWQGITDGGQTAFDTLDGAFKIQEGIVTIDSIILDGDMAKIDTTGAIDLPRWSLSTKHQMSVKNTDIPSFEIAFEGALNDPTQTFAQELLEDYLKRKLQRKMEKLFSKTLSGTISNDNEEGTNSGTTLEDAAQGALKDVLNNLLK